MEEDNGILAYVQGQFVSLGIQQLPNPITAEDRTYTVEVDAGHTGRVRLYAVRKKSRQGKNSRWFWSVYKAEAVTA